MELHGYSEVQIKNDNSRIAYSSQLSSRYTAIKPHQDLLNITFNHEIPMTTITAYLTFNGNCREAMQYYQKCLGGRLVFQTVGESPLCEKMPAKMKKYIVHSELKNPKVLLFASDMVGQEILLKGNSVSLALNCSSEKELKKYYKSLSADGEQTHPPEETYWGAIFGGLTDKFGTNWLLNYQRKK
jgi:PhnB protein